MKKIGLFFGSFNPIHIGHMAIANYIIEYAEIDQLWFIISPQNPLKKRKSLLDNYYRLEMVEMAIEGNSKFMASDIEFKMPKPSYTIDTLTYLKERHPKFDFYLIMGSDSLNTFNKWKNYDEILKNYHRYIYPRRGDDIEKLKNHKNISIINAPMIDISSSFIRQAIKDKKNIKHFLPPGIYDHIYKNQFYE